MLIILTLALLASPGIFTNGGDHRGEIDNIWFLGDKPIHYCVEFDRSWGKDPEWTRAEIRSALNDWIAFFHRQGFGERRFTRLARRGEIGMSLQFHEVPECAPNEPSLRFLMGVQTKEVQERKHSRPGSLGLASRTGFDHSSLTTAGSVFLGSFVEQRFVRHMLLQELGHVFGMPHDSVPVMVSFVADILHIETWRPYLGQIEMPTWKFQLRARDVIEFSDGSASNRLLPDGGDLFGMKPDGAHSLRFIVEDLNASTMNLRLVLRDEKRVPRLVLSGHFKVRPPDVRASGPSLFTYYHSESCAAIITGTRRLDREAPRSADGVFETRHGARYPAALEAGPGALLRIYLPQTGEWWDVGNYPSVQPWFAPRF